MEVHYCNHRFDRLNNQPAAFDLKIKGKLTSLVCLIQVLLK